MAKNNGFKAIALWASIRILILSIVIVFMLLALQYGEIGYFWYSIATGLTCSTTLFLFSGFDRFQSNKEMQREKEVSRQDGLTEREEEFKQKEAEYEANVKELNEKLGTLQRVHMLFLEEQFNKIAATIRKKTKHNKKIDNGDKKRYLSIFERMLSSAKKCCSNGDLEEIKRLLSTTKILKKETDLAAHDPKRSEPEGKFREHLNKIDSLFNSQR